MNSPSTEELIQQLKRKGLKPLEIFQKTLGKDYLILKKRSPEEKPIMFKDEDCSSQIIIKKRDSLSSGYFDHATKYWRLDDRNDNDEEEAGTSKRTSTVDFWCSLTSPIPDISPE